MNDAQVELVRTALANGALPSHGTIAVLRHGSEGYEQHGHFTSI
ncbi:hypothetical protein [Nocardia brasiliensis]|nr:hypothetical protein [Nocardia brasiliensis]